MDVRTLARFQYALTISAHYLYVPLSMGLSLLLVLLEGLYLKSGDESYRVLTKFWMRIFSLTFALGVATGLVMKSEFGTNWAIFSRYVGEIFGSGLVIEGLFAFFLESAFLGILLFGWDKVSKGVHFFATCMVCLGAHLGAIWIVIINSWMHTPAGFRVVGEGLGARAEITDFWKMCWNPSALDRILHTTFASWLYASFLIISICAYHIRRRQNLDISMRCLRVVLAFTCVCLALQLATGHLSALRVGKYQPAKMAAFEGVFETKGHVPMYGAGYLNVKDKKVIGLPLPSLLSLMLHGKPSAQVAGLDSVPEEDWPPLQFVFQTYHFMIASWGLMVCLIMWALWRLKSGRLEESKYLLRALSLSVSIPCAANLAGWYSTEVGRQPWVVWHQLRTSQALSESVTAEMVFSSLVVFALIYLVTFALFGMLMWRKIKEGPGDSRQSSAYRQPLITLNS